MKVKFLIILSLLFCSLYATPEIKEKVTDKFFYNSTEIINNGINFIGFGAREIVNNHAIDWSFSLGYRYKIKDFSNFYPLLININYLYYFNYINLYTGCGVKYQIDMNNINLHKELDKEYDFNFTKHFYPTVFNPCIIIGTTVQISDFNVFIELRNNFCRIISIISSNKYITCNKSTKKEAFNHPYFSVCFGFCY